MVRPHLAILTVIAVLFSTAIADEKTGISPASTAADLKKAKEDYELAIQQAGYKLLIAFGAQKEKLEDNKQIKVEQQLKLLDDLKAERQAFEVDSSKIPTFPAMKDAVSDYNSDVSSAKKSVKRRFQKRLSPTVTKRILMR